MIRPLLSLAILSLGLAACGSEAPAPDDKPGADAGQPVLTADAAAAPRAKAAVVLDPDGLSAGGKQLRFGSARADVDGAAEKALGLIATKSANGECGAGPMEFSDLGPLKLAFLDGKFAGWYISEGALDAVTVDGVKPGSTMDALSAERQVRPIADSTLDGEFEYLSATGGMVTGFYKGDVRSGTISGLAAGTNCFFR